jgi:two-component system, chemotaxis family, protein-glutamate methylesterase/glutaminase
MDGLTFLEKFMRAYPLPVVMISSLTDKGCGTVLRAPSLGAIDCIPKPKLSIASGTLGLSEEIIAKVKAAADARLIPRIAPNGADSPAPFKTDFAPLKGSLKIVAIGPSTGRTEALHDLLAALPADFPAIAIVQHMPEKFAAQFAKRLDSLCKISVREAADGDRLLIGRALHCSWQSPHGIGAPRFRILSENHSI